MKKERWLKMKMPTRLRPYLQALLRRGLHGNTEEEVVVRLVEESFRRIALDEYLQKYDAMRESVK